MKRFVVIYREAPLLIALLLRSFPAFAETCTFTLNPASQTFDANGGPGSVSVTTSPLFGCPWTASSNNPDWITSVAIAPSSLDTSSGTVNYTVLANTGAQRAGSITIAGQAFPITQNGGGYTPAGSNVTVSLGLASALFTNVITPGNTVLVPMPPPILPPGFRVFNPSPPPVVPGFSVDLSTTASYTGPIFVTFDLAKFFGPSPPPITPQQFARLRVLHGEQLQPEGPPIFVDRTIPNPPPILPTPPPILPIYGQVSSLSPFVIAEMSSVIAFSSSRDGNFEIYTMNSDGTGLTRLTNNPATDLFPAWSPDRTRIAFASNRDGNFEIYSMAAAGGTATRLTVNARVDGTPSWSPDGSKIAFASARDGNFEIYTMNPDGSGLLRLTNHPASDVKPTWSPDGRRIAFSSNRTGVFQIYAMNADGSGVVRLSNALAEDLSPAWSPDGKKIAFSRNLDVYVMNADGSSPVQLTTNQAVNGEPSWSPDGAKIVFESNRDSLFHFGIYVMNADGTGQTRLTLSPGSDLSPQW